MLHSSVLNTNLNSNKNKESVSEVAHHHKTFVDFKSILRILEAKIKSFKNKSSKEMFLLKPTR